MNLLNTKTPVVYINGLNTFLNSVVAIPAPCKASCINKRVWQGRYIII